MNKASLALNAVVPFNSLYLDAAAKQVAADGPRVRPAPAPMRGGVPDPVLAEPLVGGGPSSEHEVARGGRGEKE
ncbi:hypothetical protein ACFU90_14240 [Streptomyces noursei]|uniref:hypothetical protein n=1 Tax=Streptomyces noursei TaxID=1971 RepID=UPI00369AD905